MKACTRCFDYLYIFVGGDVRCCPWNRIIVGNLLENTLEEIWRGDKMEEIRHAFMQGDLLGCDEMYCPACINYDNGLKSGNKEDSSQSLVYLKEEPIKDLNTDEMEELYNSMDDGPCNISLAYDERCNHACPSCRHGFLKPDKQYRDNLKKITANIAPYLKTVRSITTNGIGELFVSEEIIGMLSAFRPNCDDFRIFFETNGVLFKDNWDKIKHLRDFHITVSVTPNSFHRETYRYLAGKDNLKKFEESMSFITGLKHSGDINHIRMIMVIQDSNYRQIPDFIRKCIEYDADDIVLRPIFKWFYLQEDEWLYKNVLNPCHPYHEDYLKVLEDPICKDPRVFNWGFTEKQEAISFPTLEMKRFFGNHVPNWKKRLHSMIPFYLKFDKLILYGAGKYGKECINELLNSGISSDFLCVAVSDETVNDKELYGIKVQDIDKLKDYTENGAVLIATLPVIAEEIRCLLEAKGYKNITELF